MEVGPSFKIFWTYGDNCNIEELKVIAVCINIMSHSLMVKLMNFDHDPRTTAATPRDALTIRPG
jgi:hypothetical protein